MLAASRFAPKTFAEIDVADPRSIQLLKRLSSSSCVRDIPHLLLAGPSGCGKRTLALAFISEIFGSGVHQTVCGPLPGIGVFSDSDARSAPQCERSRYHIEINPSDARNQRDEMSVIVKALGHVRPNPDSLRIGFTVVLVTDFGKLTIEAQSVARRAMETLTEIRFIILASSVGSVTHPIQSRCVLFTIMVPEEKRLIAAIRRLVNTMKWKIPVKDIHAIASGSKGNIREAFAATEVLASGAVLTAREAVAVCPYGSADAAAIEMSSWPCTTDSVLAMRARLYAMIEQGLPLSRFFRAMALAMVRRAKEEGKSDRSAELVAAVARHEAEAASGPNAVHHTEAAYAKCLAILQ